MVATNSINESTTGICGFTGTAFTGTPVTAHNVIIGGSTSSTLVNVAPSATSGVPVISQGASADPVFGTAVVAGGGTGLTTTTAYAVLCGGTTTTGPLQSIASVGTSGQVLTSNGAGALPTFQAAAAGGKVLQQVRVQDASYDSTTTVLPYDTTIPQNTEGKQILTLAITPLSASSTLVIDVLINLSSSTHNVAALFVDSTANALSANSMGDSLSGQWPVPIKYIVASASTSARTYKLRYGPGSAGICIYNSTGAGGTFGGAYFSSIIITEYAS